MNDSQCVFMDGNPTSIDAVVCVNGTKASTAMTSVQMCGFSIHRSRVDVRGEDT